MLPFRTFLLIMKNPFFFFFGQTVTKVEKVKGEESKTFLSCQKDETESIQGDQKECVVLFRQILRCRRREGKEIISFVVVHRGFSISFPLDAISLRVRCLCLLGGVQVVVCGAERYGEVEKGRPERS